jgi:hypothetical protein
MSGYDDDFVGSGAESDADSDEGPGTVTPVGELSDKEARGKKRGKAPQGTTPAKTPKALKQTPSTRKAAAPRTPRTKKAARPKTPATRKTSTPTPKKSVAVARKTPAAKKPRTPKRPSTGEQSSAGKYADLKRAVKPKRAAAEDKTEGETVTRATSVDTAKPQTSAHPTPPPTEPPVEPPTERMVTSPSANTDEQMAPMTPEDAVSEPRPASLPERPLVQLPPPVTWETYATPFQPVQPLINPALVAVQQSTGSLPPGPPSLPPRPPTPLEQQVSSRYNSQPGTQLDMRINNSFLGNSEHNMSFSSTRTYPASWEPNVSSPRHSFPAGLPPTMYQQPSPWQAVHQPLPFLSAVPGTQASLALPVMEAGPAYFGNQGHLTPATEQPAYPQWDEAQEDLYNLWEPSPGH